MVVRVTKRKITDFTDITDRAISSNAETDASTYLRRISSAVRAGIAPDRNDLHWAAAAFDRVLSGEPADAALGVKVGPGQRSWETRAALDQRDRLLRDAAKRFLGGLSVAAQADRLHKELSRYCASAWQRERTYERCPDRHRGSMHECLWLLLKLHDRVLSARSLRLILATS